MLNTPVPARTINSKNGTLAGMRLKTNTPWTLLKACLTLTMLYDGFAIVM